MTASPPKDQRGRDGALLGQRVDVGGLKRGVRAIGGDEVDDRGLVLQVLRRGRPSSCRA